ncbi:MAG: hypothetical protein AAFU71_13495 [Cyanobacteria bacterium J06632_22]
MILDVLSAVDARFEQDTDALDSLNLGDLAAAFGLTPPADASETTLDTATPVSLVEIFSPGFSQAFDRTISRLETASGLLLLDSGVLSGSVITAEGTESIVLDGMTFLESLRDEAETLTATATLSDDVFSGVLTLDDGRTFDTAVDAGSLLESAIFTLLNQADVVVPFTNGQFAVDIPTTLGAVTGSVDFAGGDLNVDLNTPLGDLGVDYEFSPNAIIRFDLDSPLGQLPGRLDLAAGLVVVPLGFFGAITLDLEMLSGEVTLADGMASLSVAVPDFGFAGIPSTITTDIDLGPLASEIVEGFEAETAGSLTITSGQVIADIVSPLGRFDTAFSLVDLTTDAIDFLTATTGMLTLDNGRVTAALETPLGPVDTLTTVAEIDDFLTTPLLA